LKPKIFETEATFSERGANLFPSNLALTAIHFVFPDPKERAAMPVDFQENADREQDGAHEMSWEGLKNGIDKDRMTGQRQKLTDPAGEPFVNLSDDWGESRDAELMSGQRNPKISLRKRGDRAAKKNLQGKFEETRKRKPKISLIGYMYPDSINLQFCSAKKTYNFVVQIFRLVAN
jgi:hypothetical protein